MLASQNIGEFYGNKPGAGACGHNLQNAGTGHFNVFSRDNAPGNPAYRRRNFYKISFINGVGRVHFADKWIEAGQPVLIFSSPRVAYAWEAAPDEVNQTGWFCVFTEPFLQAGDRIGPLQESPLFGNNSLPVFFPNQEQQIEITLIFQKMVREMESDYEHKYTVLRNCLHLLLYEAMKISPTAAAHKQINASSRIAHLFFDLLERQFRFDKPSEPLLLRGPQDYASSLCIHVNHLNRAVKEITGKTTSEHIAARIVQEANMLLQQSDLSISEIAYSLGFEYPAYFTRFFRKNTGHPPLEQRRQAV
jgi:AraC-like DNA-binding protein